MEINGFTIDKYNFYGLQENAKESICPLCSHNRKKKNDKCAKLNWETGLGKCFHCNEIFQLHTFKKRENTIVKIFSKPTWKNNTELSENVVKWFERRKISQQTLRQMKICEGIEIMPSKKNNDWREMNTIQFPYFRDNELINCKFRTGEKGFKLIKDAEKIFYNLNAIKYSKECIICEGEIDVLSFIECDIDNVISVPNGSTLKNPNLEYLDNCIDYFENKEKIYLAIDNDEAGQVTTTEFIRRFGSEKCFLVDFKDCKDANEYLVKYGKSSLSIILENAKEVPIDGVSSVGDWKESFENYLINGMQKGFRIGLDGFDNIFTTYTGQVIGITGVPSSGKSDFVDQMCLGYNALYNWKTAYASPENKPNEIHAGKLISKICGKWINSKYLLQTSQYADAFDLIHNNFKFIDLENYDLKFVLEKTKMLIKRFGIKVLVIDPYNKVRLKDSLNKNITEYTNDYLIELDNFARKYDILIILVAHPRKPSNLEGKSYEPNMYDIKGGGEMYDMLPHGLLVHRDYEAHKVKIKVLKCKFSHLGKNNEHCYFEWDKNSGRYLDHEFQTENVNELGNIIYKSVLDNEYSQSEMPMQIESQVKDNYEFDCQGKATVSDNYFTNNEPAPF